MNIIDVRTVITSGSHRFLDKLRLFIRHRGMAFRLRKPTFNEFAVLLSSINTHRPQILSWLSEILCFLALFLYEARVDKQVVNLSSKKPMKACSFSLFWVSD